jgi:acetyltransferase-like isoleucine patch superfamily enzyme
MDALIYANVIMGESAEIDKFVIIGQSSRGKKQGEIQTIIGSSAVIRSHTVIYAGNKIGNNFQTGHHVMIREDNVIGNNVSVGTGTVIEHHIKIGDGVRIHSQVFIPEYCILEEGCWIGPNAVLTNAKHPNRPDTKQKLAGVVVGKNAVIGANVTILPGIHIGENSLIGAGTILSKNVPDNMIVYNHEKLNWQKNSHKA